MSSNALEAQGFTLGISDGTSPITYNDISEIKSISGPGGSATVIDVSDLSSSRKEKRLGLPDEGQLQLTINYIPTDTQHTLLRTQRSNRTLTQFQLTFTDASPKTTWTFSAYVNQFQLQNIQVDGTVEAQVTLEISGTITES